MHYSAAAEVNLIIGSRNVDWIPFLYKFSVLKSRPSKSLQIFLFICFCFAAFWAAFHLASKKLPCLALFWLKLVWLNYLGGYVTFHGDVLNPAKYYRNCANNCHPLSDCSILVSVSVYVFVLAIKNFSLIRNQISSSLSSQNILKKTKFLSISEYNFLGLNRIKVLLICNVIINLESKECELEVTWYFDQRSGKVCKDMRLGLIRIYCGLWGPKG